LEQEGAEGAEGAREAAELVRVKADRGSAFSGARSKGGRLGVARKSGRPR
jgi:hypothetical protein